MIRDDDPRWKSRDARLAQLEADVQVMAKWLSQVGIVCPDPKWISLATQAAFQRDMHLIAYRLRQPERADARGEGTET